MSLATLKPIALTHICANIILDSPNLLLNRMSSYDNLLLKPVGGIKKPPEN